MERDLEEDMRGAPWFMEKIKDNKYAQNVYAAFCNMRWQPQDVWSILKDEDYWSCSWRSAGRIVSELRGEGDYLDWYCSGIGSGVTVNDPIKEGHVPEGCVTDEIKHDLGLLGWQPSEWPNNEQVDH